MKHPSAKRVILFSLLALALSLAQPMLIAFSAAVCIAPVFIALIYAWAGWIPALILAAGTTGVMGALGGMLAGESLTVVFAAAALLMLVLPGFAGIWALNRRLPFFRRMIVTVAAQIAGMTAVLCIVYLGYHADLVDLLTSYLRASVEVMPAGMLQTVLQNFYVSGMLTEESVNLITTGIVTAADIRKVLNQAFDTMNYQIRFSLPALMLNSGLLTGIFMTSLPSLVCARRGDEPHVDYHPVSEWFLPARAVGGLAVCMITSYVLLLSSVSGAEAATATVIRLGQTLFAVQGVASLSRRFKENGLRRGARIALIIAGVVLASGFVTLLGALSSIFGRKGVLTGWMRKRMEEQQRGDDDE